MITDEKILKAIDEDNAATIKIWLDSGQIALGRTISHREITLLQQAASQGKSKIVEFLLAQGVDPNASGLTGTPPLIYAISGEHIEVVKMLLGAGADLNRQTAYGDNALGFIEKIYRPSEKHVQIKKLLEKALQQPQEPSDKSSFTAQRIDSTDQAWASSYLNVPYSLLTSAYCCFFRVLSGTKAEMQKGISQTFSL